MNTGNSFSNPHRPDSDSVNMLESNDNREAGSGNSQDSGKRKRKRKGLGGWTRTVLACSRCRKMKIKVFPTLNLLTRQCDDARPCGNCQRWSLECITTHTEGFQTRNRYFHVEGSSQFSEHGDRTLRKQRLESIVQEREVLRTSPDDVSATSIGEEIIVVADSPQLQNSSSVNLLQIQKSQAISGLSDPSETMPSVLNPDSPQRLALFAEANHRRWAAESAVGPACKGVTHSLVMQY